MRGKAVLIAFITINILFLSVSDVQAKNNPYARDYQKKYTFSFGNQNVNLVKTKDKDYVIEGLEYAEGWIGNKYFVSSSGVGSFYIDKDVSKTKKVVYKPAFSDRKVTKKVTFTKKVKTKYKTFNNCLKLTDGYTVLYLAPKYGLIKYSQNGKVVFQLKNVKSGR